MNKNTVIKLAIISTAIAAILVAVVTSLSVSAQLFTSTKVDRIDPSSKAGPAKPTKVRVSKFKSKPVVKRHSRMPSIPTPNPKPPTRKPRLSCPKDTMNIGTKGSPVCKIIPTGCPNGDSIPMEFCYKDSDTLTDK